MNDNVAQVQPLSEIGELVSATLSGESLWFDGPIVETRDERKRTDNGAAVFDMSIGDKVYTVEIREVTQLSIAVDEICDMIRDEVASAGTAKVNFNGAEWEVLE